MEERFSIKPLTPDLAETFTEYLGQINFDHAPHWSTCFCRYYHTTCSLEEWMDRSGETNRDEALTRIREGRMKGYLAFEDEKCIGWCNANDVQKLVRISGDMKEYC